MAGALEELQEVLVVPPPPVGTTGSLRGDLEWGVAMQAVSVPIFLRHLILSHSTLSFSSPGT